MSSYYKNHKLKQNSTKKKYYSKRLKNSTKKNNVFTKKDYLSGDGMVTKIWGPPLWHFLHTMSFNYPVKPTPVEKKQYKEFIISLKNILPCKHCRINLEKNFKTFPLKDCNMKNRGTFSYYIYCLHERINKLLGKKSNLSYNQVRERYEHFRARCTEKDPKIFKFNKKNTRKAKKKEEGCTDPMYGVKSKCLLNIVPDNNSSHSIKIDKKCLKKK